MKSARPNSPAILMVIAILVVGGIAFGVGFDLLPATELHATLWERICEAAGSPAAGSPAAGSPAGASGQRALAPLPGFTGVVLTPAAMSHGSPLQIGRGATLALRCTPCHGAQGVSGALAPNLAGQYSEVIYKQLVDFKRGARADAVMAAIVAPLTDAGMLDLAHYYAYLPEPESDQPAGVAPVLVRVGDPMRNIAPCASCHGRDDGKVGAPSLTGEPKAYLKAQLTAFATGSRKNDANGVMRGEARRLSSTEIDTVTAYYAATSPPATREAAVD
jgi:cytochrome c553